jgi:hypothetical protein
MEPVHEVEILAAGSPAGKRGETVRKGGGFGSFHFRLDWGGTTTTWSMQTWSGDVEPFT